VGTFREPVLRTHEPFPAPRTAHSRSAAGRPKPAFSGRCRSHPHRALARWGWVADLHDLLRLDPPRCRVPEKPRREPIRGSRSRARRSPAPPPAASIPGPAAPVDSSVDLRFDLPDAPDHRTTYPPATSGRCFEHGRTSQEFPDLGVRPPLTAPSSKAGNFRPFRCPSQPRAGVY
jgi:hypothetical protein